MKSIVHCSLESGTCILQAKREIFVRKSTLRIDEGSFLLIGRQNIDLAVTRKEIHKREYLTPSTVVNKLVNKGSKIVIFRTCTIVAMIINTNPNSALLFGHRENV